MLGYNDTSATVSAAGNNLATATGLRNKFNFVSVAAASTGVSLPTAAAPGDVVFVRNGGANALSVYPATAAGTIGGGSAGAAVSLAVTNDKTKNAMFVCWGSDVWTQVVSA
jgi:hypothetical protein